MPDIVTQNANSGGNAVDAVLGGLGRAFGGRAVGPRRRHQRLQEGGERHADARQRPHHRAGAVGYARKQDVGFSLGADGFRGGGWGAAAASGYENTDIGQVIVLAYLKAYTDLVTQLGGLPADPSSAAPPAR